MNKKKQFFKCMRCVNKFFVIGYIPFQCTKCKKIMPCVMLEKEVWEDNNILEELLFSDDVILGDIDDLTTFQVKINSKYVKKSVLDSFADCLVLTEK